MNMPVLCDVPTPEYLYCASGCSGVWHSEKCKPITLENLRNKLLSNDYSKISITTNFQHMDLLPKEIQEEIYAKSASRKCINALNEPSEPEEPFDYTKAENPCLAPVLQTFLDRGGMTMQLSLCKDKEGVSAYLNVGPGAYFEYTMYVLGYMSERFPSIQIDMESGFNMCCCNFHASAMYQYEKVRGPVKHNVNHTLKHLAEYGLMSFKISHDENYTPHINYAANGFFTATHFWGYGEKETQLTLTDYLNLIEMSLADEPDPAKQMFITAVNIILPLPEVLAGDAAPSTTPASGRTQILEQLWPYTGYMSFYNENGVIVCELRISADMKEYLNTWLTKAEAGMIDFIKPEMYKLRKEQDAL
ncbi:MAG: hypothetical protein FWB75_07375 [Oscillospiraceae bacterium]|nr:hypothetical protein [Oscillospiraceae bacterium]